MSSESEWNSWVRWAECDAAGIIYHARVFDWFSEGRIAWLNDHQLSYYELLRPHGVELLVKSATAAFHHALRHGDPVRLRISMETLTPTRVSFRYWMAAPANPDVTALEGLTEHAFVVDNRARRLDRMFPDIFAQFERGR